jgi:hypothetical protein
MCGRIHPWAQMGLEFSSLGGFWFLTLVNVSRVSISLWVSFVNLCVSVKDKQSWKPVKVVRTNLNNWQYIIIMEGPHLRFVQRWLGIWRKESGRASGWKKSKKLQKTGPGVYEWTHLGLLAGVYGSEAAASHRGWRLGLHGQVSGGVNSGYWHPWVSSPKVRRASVIQGCATRSLVIVHSSFYRPRLRPSWENVSEEPDRVWSRIQSLSFHKICQFHLDI